MQKVGIISAFLVGVLCASSVALLAQPKAPTTATHWEVRYPYTENLEKQLQRNGWEPFAVTLSKAAWNMSGTVNA